MSAFARAGVILACALAVVGCRRSERFHEAQQLGGVEISAEQLNRGDQLYGERCASCHGVRGAGDGPGARGLNPPARDLRTGLFEFTTTRAGSLPTNGDLVRLIRHGLQGTAMGPTDLSEVDAAAIGQYLKTLSPRWLHDPPSPPVHPSAEYGTAAKRQKKLTPEQWLTTGDRLYHIDGSCWSCHPAYETKEYIYNQSYRRTSSFRADLYSARTVPSLFGHDVKATDFLTDTLKAGASDEALYRTIAAGLGGVQMPPGIEIMEEAKIWALVYYVRSLIDQKEHGTAAALEAKLQAQASWVPGQ